MQDTVELIKKEMPVVMVVTDRFVNEALEVAKNSGQSEFLKENKIINS